MIVVDTSVWIDYFRNEASIKTVRLLDGDVLTDLNEIIVGDLILLECLQGARDERHAKKLENHLSAFQVLPMLDSALAIEAAKNYRKLRAVAVTPRKTIDLIIGTFCIANDFRLLHNDADFLPMQKHLGLKSFAL